MPVLQRVLTRPLLWWALAVVWLVRDVYGNVIAPDRPDARALMVAGSDWLHQPSAIYSSTERVLSTTGYVPAFGFVKPPVAAMLGAPFTLLPASWQVPVWTASDALAAVVALVLLQRYVAHAPLEKAVFWAVALYCPPLYAEVNAGQLGGWLLLFAVAGLVVFRKQTASSGVLVAVAASLKFYPALMVVGARERWRQFLLGAAIGGVVVTVAACIPLGLAGTREYVTKVLVPTLRAANNDCAQTSVATLYGRSIGGVTYPIVTPSGGIALLQSPIHLALVASILTVLTLIAVTVAAVLAARASGWNPTYGMAIGLALGGILPGELNPYQYLPLLPLVLIVLVVALRNHRWTYVAAFALGLLLWWRQPCLLPFPNLWTIGALILFTVAALAARQFRTES